MDLIERIISFLTNRNHSPLSKISWVMVAFLLIFLIDNYLGFSYHFRINQEIEQIKNIEEIKQISQDNIKLISFLNNKENEILNRKNIFQHFSALFDKEELKSDTDNTYKVEEKENDNKFKDFFINLFPEMPQRSQLWHTLTSASLWVLLLLIIVIYLFTLPFIQEKDKGNIILGIVSFTVILAGLIWLTQYLFGLIPVILNRAYINYTIQILLQILFFAWLYKIGSKTKTKTS